MFLLYKNIFYICTPYCIYFYILLFLHCQINAYGFITEDHNKYTNYYYEKLKTKVIFYINHDYGLELKTWKKFHDLGIINLYQRKEYWSFFQLPKDSVKYEYLVYIYFVTIKHFQWLWPNKSTLEVVMLLRTLQLWQSPLIYLYIEHINIMF